MREKVSRGLMTLGDTNLCSLSQRDTVDAYGGHRHRLRHESTPLREAIGTEEEDELMAGGGVKS